MEKKKDFQKIYAIFVYKITKRIVNMSVNNNHLVIMAGGVGSRFWPMSTPDYPKQFIDVLGCGRTLSQLTMGREEFMVYLRRFSDLWRGAYDTVY